jgi:hypothetical protein
MLFTPIMIPLLKISLLSVAAFAWSQQAIKAMLSADG